MTNTAETEYAEIVRALSATEHHASVKNPLEWRASDAIDALLAENARLKEAMTPFAAVAMDSALSDHPDSYAPRPARGSPHMGDFRRARAALHGDPQ